MVEPDVLISPRLKVQRANRHIDELIALTQPLSDELHTLRVERDVGPPGGEIDEYALVFRPIKPIASMLALTIGDAVHNLRAALDHLCTGILRTVDPTAKAHFPIHPTRKNFVTAPVLNLIEEAIPGAKRLIIQEIRPDNGPNEALWAFNTLDNDDKHNLLIPTTTVANIYGADVTFGTVSVRGLNIGADAAQPIFIIGSQEPITVHGDLQTTIDVRFAPGSAFENEPVVPTLVQVAQVVTETIDAFERLIRA